MELSTLAAISTALGGPEEHLFLDHSGQPHLAPEVIIPSLGVGTLPLLIEPSLHWLFRWPCTGNSGSADNHRLFPLMDHVGFSFFLFFCISDTGLDLSSCHGTSCSGSERPCTEDRWDRLWSPMEMDLNSAHCVALGKSLYLPEFSLGRATPRSALSSGTRRQNRFCCWGFAGAAEQGSRRQPLPDSGTRKALLTGARCTVPSGSSLETKATPLAPGVEAPAPLLPVSP